LDSGDLRDDERVALRRAALTKRSERRRLHAQNALCDGGAIAGILVGDINHARAAGRILMGESRSGRFA
jgi:hypothetical protein